MSESVGPELYARVILSLAREFAGKLHDPVDRHLFWQTVADRVDDELAIAPQP